MKAFPKSSEIMDTGEPPSPATASIAPSVDNVDSHLLQPHSSTTDGSQEVLGLVTHDTTISSGDKCSPIQLRTSARVSKKLKLNDSQNLPSTSATAATERKGSHSVAYPKSKTCVNLISIVFRIRSRGEVAGREKCGCGNGKIEYCSTSTRIMVDGG